MVFLLKASGFPRGLGWKTPSIPPRPGERWLQLPFGAMALSRRGLGVFNGGLMGFNGI